MVYVIAIGDVVAADVSRKREEEPLQLARVADKQDEIDLFELVNVLWRGKWLLLAIALVVTVIGAGIAFSKPDIWGAKSRISLPQPYDLQAFSQQIAKYKPLFDALPQHSDSGAGDSLSHLNDANVLFQRFIGTFSSVANQKLFIQSQQIFADEKTRYFSADATLDNKETLKYAKELDDNPFLAIYSLTVSSSSSQRIDDVMESYVNFTRHRVAQFALSNLESVVTARQQELLQSQRLLLNTLDAQSPTSNDTALQTNPLLKQKTQENSQLEHDLLTIHSTLQLLSDTPFDKNIEFQPYHLLDASAADASLHKPKRALIIILALLLGVMLGAAILLIRHAFKSHR